MNPPANWPPPLKAELIMRADRDLLEAIKALRALMPNGSPSEIVAAAEIVTKCNDALRQLRPRRAKP